MHGRYAQWRKLVACRVDEMCWPLGVEPLSNHEPDAIFGDKVVQTADRELDILDSSRTYIVRRAVVLYLRRATIENCHFEPVS